MLRKSFDELKITDDFMFYSVMQDESLCKTLLSIVLSEKIGTITEIHYQNTLDSSYLAKNHLLFPVFQKAHYIKFFNRY